MVLDRFGIDCLRWELIYALSFDGNIRVLQQSGAAVQVVVGRRVGAMCTDDGLHFKIVRCGLGGVSGLMAASCTKAGEQTALTESLCLGGGVACYGEEAEWSEPDEDEDG